MSNKTKFEIKTVYNKYGFTAFIVLSFIVPLVVMAVFGPETKIGDLL